MKKKLEIESSSSELESELFDEELALAVSLSLKTEILDVQDALKIIEERAENFINDFYV